MMSNWESATNAERVEHLIREHAYLIYICRDWFKIQEGSDLTDWTRAVNFVQYHYQEIWRAAQQEAKNQQEHVPAALLTQTSQFIEHRC